ncbi:MAG: hypothetical protein HY303_16165, partial [Candidatus Wallbacteria bacterium]|nr:hypothetical protein [Candidatus Wallbacteria bacterium]
MSPRSTGPAGLALAVGAGLLAAVSWAQPPRDTVVIGAKNFTEQIILGEMLS